MDLEAYGAVHRGQWDELDRLARRRHASGDDVDRMLSLYQSGATDLARIRGTVARSSIGDRLSLTLFRTRLRFTGTPGNVVDTVATFFALQLPAALHRIRWVTLVLAAATAVIAVVTGLWISSDPRAISTFGSDAALHRYATQDFIDYYSDHSLASFTGKVWTNNAFLAAEMVAFGVTGLFVPYAIMNNGISLGVSGAIMHSQGRLGDFFLYIAPHGQLELYSVFMAGAAGLMIFWSWLVPGGRTRGQALAEDGRALVAVAIGLVLTLLMSGIVEGTVTRQPWPWPVKIGIGTVALAAVLYYQWVIGGRAVRSGQRGDVEEFDRGASVLVAG